VDSRVHPIDLGSISQHEFLQILGNHLSTLMGS
jgi:hypothetical protein